MNHLARIQEHLPSPYTLASDAVLTQFLDVVALELEAFQEDLDRMRKTHWIHFAFRLADAEKLAALVGVKRLPWETLQTFRARLLPLVKARLNGALGPLEIKRFVYDYLRGTESALSDVDSQLVTLLVPGLRRVPFEQSFSPLPKRPLFRPLELRENPKRRRTSGHLAARSGRVPYLFRWEESNKGLMETVATFAISGWWGGKTAVPVLVNLTTGDLLGYVERVPFGQTLLIRPAEGTEQLARASLNDADVTDRLFSMRGFALGVPFAKKDLDESPRLPRLARGSNEWIFLSIGLYDIKGLNHFFFSLAGQDLREGVFDQTFFDSALFPSGIVTRLEMEWEETEPASFEVRVPRFLVAEPAMVEPGEELRPYEQIAEGLEESIRQLHAAGVRAEVQFIPSVETHPQKVGVTLPWKVIDRQKGSAGESDALSMGGRFGETSLGDSRYE
jgi:hypothetical protein